MAGKPKCCIPDCDGTVHRREWCQKHYRAWRLYGDPLKTFADVGTRRRGRLCSIPECGRRHWAKGYCRPHYESWKRYGDPLAAKPRGNPIRRCDEPDCGEEHYALGYCQPHYMQHYKAKLEEDSS